MPFPAARSGRTPSTYNGLAVQSTTTALWLKNTSIIASSTIFTNASTSLLTISGGYVDYSNSPATSTIINNNPFAWTLATSTTGKPAL